MEAVVFHTEESSSFIESICERLEENSCRYSLKKIPEMSSKTIQEQFLPLPQDATHLIFVFPLGEFNFMGAYVFLFFAGYCLGKNIRAVAVNTHSNMSIPAQFKSVAKFINISELPSLLTEEAKRIGLEKTSSDAKQMLLGMGIPFFSESFFKAITSSDEHVCELFLQAGFDTNMKDIEGNPPLTVAVRAGSLAIVEMLLSSGADINAPSGDRGYSPLMDAVYSKKPEIATLLLERGANPNVVGSDAQTAICIAAGRGDMEMCNLLIKYEANPTIPDALGMTAMGYAKLFKNEELCSLFGVSVS